MALTAVPLVFVLIGLACYIILAGADFGAAIWQITAPQTREGRRIRDFAHNVMAPVWEANHVWLIFVLTVTWTAYPAAFGSIASTLSIALIVAALGVVIRGAAHAVSAGTSGPPQGRVPDFVSAISSIVTPFALGACVGGIASGRVPYGRAQGGLVSSWLNPTSAVIGALAIAISAYLAAVYLCDDAQRRGEHALVAPYRRRALGAGTVAGLLAFAGLGGLPRDAHPLYPELIARPGRPALIVSGAGGLAARGPPALPGADRRPGPPRRDRVGCGGRLGARARSPPAIPARAPCRGPRRRGDRGRVGARPTAPAPARPDGRPGRRPTGHADRRDHRRRRRRHRRDPFAPRAAAAVRRRPPRRLQRRRRLRRPAQRSRPGPGAPSGPRRAPRHRLPHRRLRLPHRCRGRVGARDRRDHAARRGRAGPRGGCAPAARGRRT